jgi:3-oxoadipate enol-lactonase
VSSRSILTLHSWCDVATDVDAAPIAWREAGAGSPTLLLLHGLGGTRLSWDDQLHGLEGVARVAAWDAPGYGASAAVDGVLTFDLLARAVLDWADTLGAARFHLAGLSFGGMISQYVAAAAPDRVQSLTLLSTSPKFGLDGTAPAEWQVARLAPLDAGQSPADFAPQVLGAIAGPTISPVALAAQVKAMARISAAGLRAAIACIVTHDTRALLGHIRARTLVAVGELDDETPPTYAAALVAGIPDARLEVIGGAGHLLNAEAPDAVSAILLRQLQEPS